jgi:hypothetical protein
MTGKLWSSLGLGLVSIIVGYGCRDPFTGRPDGLIIYPIDALWLLLLLFDVAALFWRLPGFAHRLRPLCFGLLAGFVAFVVTL